MATTTKPNEKYTDDYGIERTRKDDPGAIEKAREKYPFVDHIMRMVERYGSEGGNQFAAGITYYSVLSLFPIAMLIVAIAATVLVNKPELLEQLQQQITDAVPGQFSETINEILEKAIEQRGAMFGVGGLTTLWSGLNWMNHLRVGISSMWGVDANDGAKNFFMKKLSDLGGLIGLLVALLIAFGVTAAGSSGLTQKVFEMVGIESFPGMSVIIFFVGLAVGLLANFIVFMWLIVVLPRVKVPRKSGLIGAAIGAVLFEVIKQLSTVIISSATGNPAGAVFGPVIIIMVMMYLVWRVVLYVSAWTATTEESMDITEESETPVPAVIRVRNEIKKGPSTGATLGVGALVGAVTVSALSLFRKK
ncbi:ribonuclease [Corynebacterium phocae]|uniref:Ribonuclease n=1 Tax=Corynebacterium phocae TaxID=161895 RepID=A0A1L7D4S1_9CORY|nr:YihY/virulence factor BrkB family protein [Corynebacterium phocae]APT93144.1 ribonuclease [Corynebacterium phocae]KAA8722222.1 YihY/virulence factor BrkB family protein [Corynebacterium phocae]